MQVLLLSFLVVSVPKPYHWCFSKEWTFVLLFDVFIKLYIVFLKAKKNINQFEIAGIFKRIFSVITILFINEILILQNWDN